MVSLEIRSLENAGAEVTGIDLSAITVGDADQLEAAFAAFGLLVFRDQTCSRDAVARFAERWGSPVFLDGADSFNGEPGVWNGGDSYVNEPALGTFLFSASASNSLVTIAFASLPAAFNELASTTRGALEGLRATHVAPTGASSEHPLVIRHPLSGEPALYLNPGHTVAVEGMSDEAGMRLLNELIAHCQSDEYIAHVELEPGTIVFWDHRSLWHFSDGLAHGTGGFMGVRVSGSPLRPAVPPDKSDPTFAQRAGATLAGGIITAAMTGIGEVLEPERLRQDIEIVSEAPDREPLGDNLDFGDLPPLD